MAEVSKTPFYVGGLLKYCKESKVIICAATINILFEHREMIYFLFSVSIQSAFPPLSLSLFLDNYRTVPARSFFLS